MGSHVMSKERLRQTIVGVVALVIWIVMLRSMSDFPSRASAFPRFVLICLMVFSALHIMSQLAGAYRDRGGHEAVIADAPAVAVENDDAAPIVVVQARRGVFTSRIARAIVFTVAVVIYALVIPVLGYLISTWLFVIGALVLVVGWRLRAMIACCVAVTVLWAVATQLLELRLPAGLIV